jgi:hypothetical protein
MPNLFPLLSIFIVFTFLALREKVLFASAGTAPSPRTQLPNFHYRHVWFPFPKK